MGVVKTCVFMFVVLVELQYIVAKPVFESLICDFLCGDDGSSDYCDCSSEESTEDKSPTTGKPSKLNQNITIKIPASQGTILDILNINGVWSVNVDAQGTQSPAGAASTTAAPAATTAAGGATTAAATTAKAR